MRTGWRSLAAATLVTVAALALIGPAHAARLQAEPGDPLWLRLFYDALLWLHIGGGAVGMVTGAAAVLSRKGGTIHRAAGTVFFIAMAITYAIGAGVAPFLDQEQRTNFAAGLTALYLLLSGWWTMKRKTPETGAVEMVGLAFAVAIAATGAYFLSLASQDPSGTVDGAPAQSFYLFIIVGTFAALGELHVLVRRRVAGGSRLARHLWRMNMSWFIAAGSFFLGQQQLLPEWFRNTPGPFIGAFAPLIAMLFFLVWIRVRRRFFGAAQAAAAAG